jgi:hypothetical protein
LVAERAVADDRAVKIRRCLAPRPERRRVQPTAGGGRGFWLKSSATGCMEEKVRRRGRFFRTFFLPRFDLFRRATTHFRHAVVDDCPANAGR